MRPQFVLRMVLLALALIPFPRLMAAENYQLGPDSMEQPGVPKGAVTSHLWNNSKVFTNTIREYFLYVPQQYDPKKSVALMVFQDGHSYVNPKGDFRVPIVLDNLIHKKEIPVMLALFVNPGHRGEIAPTNAWNSNNRSVEYDTLSDAYSRFLLQELLPEISRQHPFDSKPESRGICGASSGGICAWTVAWERPDQFRKVLSSIGSFTNIRGGHNYPYLIRKTERKPIRIFLQDGTGDLDNIHGNWPLGNEQMASALKFGRYDYKIVWGDGGHNGKHAGSIFPDAMRWLWRDYAP